MFESLLEQILQKFLGKFVQGLNSQNLKLGVWSGNVVIENVAIKPEVLEMFEIPIALKYSSIGKLSLQVPWSSLSSSPVEVFLEKVFIIIGAKQQDEWKFVDYNTIMKKLELIENYVKTCIQKFIEKEKSLTDSAQNKNPEQQAGYFEKLKSRIIDNIQVTIKSIHVRFENEGIEGLHDELKYSWGLTLDQLDIYTTDSNWQKAFFDRTDPKNKDKPMNKLLKLSSFCVYWNSSEKNQLSKKTPAEILVSLTNLIKRPTDKEPKTSEILNINAGIKLVQNINIDKFESPEFVIDIDLAAIHTNLQKSQLQEIIHLVDFFNVYHTKLMEKRKSASIISEQDKQRHEKEFVAIYDKFQRSEGKTLEVLNPDERQLFQDILTAEPIEDIFPWVKTVAKNIQKDQRLLEIEAKKQKDAQGWLGGWWGGSAAKVEITSEEKNQWEKFFEDHFSDESMKEANVLRPKDYVWFQLDFRLEGGSITLSNLSKDGDEEGVQFQFEGMKAVLLQRGEKNMEFGLKVMEFDIDMITKYKGSMSNVKTSFLKKNEIVVRKDDAFLSLKFEKYPNEVPEGEVQPDSQITLVNKSAKVVYNPIATKRLIDFFDVKLEHDELKDAAWKQLEKLNDATKKSLTQVMLSQTIMKLNILLESPYIIVPFQANNDPSNECWLLNLGTLKVLTNNFQLRNDVPTEEKIYDMYDVQLIDFKMQYFPSVTSLMKTYEQPLAPVLPEGSFSVIPGFTTTVRADILKSAVEEIVKDKTNFVIKVSIPNFALNFCPQIYQKLLKITDSLIISEDKESMEMMQTEKSSLMANCKKMGEVWRRHHVKHNWEKYIAVLSGSYIYFFEKAKDLQASKYQYIRNSTVKRLPDGELGMKNTFSIENRYGKVYLACEKTENTEAWMDLISKYQDSVSFQRKDTKKLAKQTTIPLENPDKLKLSLEYHSDNVELTLFDDDQKKPWFIYKSQKFRVDVKQFPYNISVGAFLGKIEILDPIRIYQNEKSNYFLKCVASDAISNDEKDDFLKVKVSYIDRKHPMYQKVDTDLDIELGAFLLNFKPDTLLKLLSFIKPKQEETKVVAPTMQSLKTMETMELMKTEMDENITTINLKLFLQKVSLSMVHKQSYLTIAELNISDTKVVLQMKLQEMYFELELGNFQLIDLTNYPTTLYREEDYLNSKRRELLGLDCDSKEKALISVKFMSYQEGCSKIKNNINSEAIINVNSVRVDFAMQPVFRILDYVLVQIVGVLTTPEIFDKNLATTKVKVVNPLEGKSPEKILNNIEKTPNMRLDITIKKPLIYLRSAPESPDYLLIDLGVITINNDRQKVQRRKDGRALFCDFYRIWMKDMGIKVNRGKEQFEMSLPYHFNLEVEKPGFIEEYKHCYKDEDLDFSLRIKSRILPIILSLHKTDYLLIMKILFANISYDDQMDRYHIYQYPQNEQNEQKEQNAPVVIKEMVKKEDDNKAQLSFFLDIDDITIFIMSPLKSNEGNAPLARIALVGLRINFIKRISNVLDLEVFGSVLKGNYFENKQEHCLFGEFKPAREFNVSEHFLLSKLRPEFLQSRIIEYTQEFEFEQFDEKNKDINLKVKLLMYPNGNKDINISLNTVRVNCHAGVLMTLSSFATMDDSVTPPDPIGKKINKDDAAGVAGAVPIVSNQDPAKMAIKIDIQNLMVLITCPGNQRPLALRGNIDLDLEMQGSRSINYLVKRAAEMKKEKKEGIFNEYELNRVFKLEVGLKNIELFICHYEEMMTGEHQVLKRNILLPLNMTFSMNSYLAWTDQFLFFNKTKNKVIIKDKTIFRISYQDISNIQKIAAYQQKTIVVPAPEPLPDSPKKTGLGKKRLMGAITKVQQNVKTERNREKLIFLKPKKTVKKELKSDDIVGNAKKKGDIMKISDTQFEILTNDIELVIVNDAGDAFIPVIDINIDDMTIIMKSSLLMMNILTPLSLNVSYYNPQVSRWEPIIEKADFLIELTTNTFQYPRMELKINSRGAEFNEEKKEGEDTLTDDYIPFNINVSTQMLGVLLKTLKLMSHETKAAIVGYQKDIQGEGPKSVEEEEKKDDEERKQEEENKKEEEEQNRKSMIPDTQEEIEYVSPYSIKNETGYEIEVRREKVSSKNEGKVYTLDNGETMNLQIESDRDQLFSAESNENMAKISVTLKKTHIHYSAIQGLDLTRVKTTRYALKEVEKKIEEQLFLITDVGLDATSNRRLITISSQLLFRNRSLKNLVIKIMTEKDKDLELVLPTNAWLPIPLDLVKKNMKLRYEDSEVWSELYSLAKLISNNTSNSYEIKMSLIKKPEMAALAGLANSFLMFTVEKEGRGFGKTVVYIDPPYLVKNCIPLDMEIQITSTWLPVAKYYKLTPQQENHEYDVPTSTKFMVSLRLAGFGWSEPHKLYSPNTEFSREIKIKDGDGNEAVVYIFHVESFVGAKKFFFYLKSYIINETTYKLVFFGVEKDQKSNKKNKKILPGQGRGVKDEKRNLDLVMLNENQEEVEIKDKNNEQFSSKEVPLGTIGDSAVEFQTKDGYLHLGVSIKLLCVDNATSLYTKVISFTPRYIFVNMLDMKMGLQQVGTDQCFVIVEKDREPYKWEDHKKPKKIYYTIITGDKPIDWEWSGEIDISAVGRTNFLLHGKNKPIFKYMKAEIINDQGLIYIIIDEYKPGFEPYYLEQSLDNNFEITLIQDIEQTQNLKHPPFILDNKAPIPFCWDYPNDKKMLKLMIRDPSGGYQDFHHLISIDKIDYKANYSLVAHDKVKYPEYGFQIVTVIENQSKRTAIKKYEKKKKDSKNINLEEETDKKLINREVEISCRISHIGLNIIQNTGTQTREILYVTLRNFEFCRVDTKKTKTMQVKVRYLNIDNNNTYLVNYPVLLTPTENKKITQKGKYFLNFYVEQSQKHEEVSNYKAIKMELEPFSIKVEDTLISVIIEFYTVLAEVLWPKDADKTEAQGLRYFYQLNKNQRPEFWFWEKDEITMTNQQTFIDEFILSPIKLNLTFLTKSKGAEFNGGLAVLTMFFKALGVALANIDDAPIKLTGLKLENCFDTTGGITSKLISHYKNNLTTEVFKLLGSINIIGNPVGLFSQIGTGMQDLIEKPMEGFIKGPLEGGVGIVKGAGSLLKHTLAGTLNSVDKITGSLGTGIASLSLDDEYLAQREKMKMKKAKHVGEGLKQAGMSIFTGFEKGITGVFLKPIEGASKGGVKGFLKGTFQGISGLIVKPVSGLLDAASKTAEGIKNTATSGDDRPRETRERLLRVFYTYDKYYQDFDKKDAELNYFLQVEMKKGRFVGSTYFYGHLFPEEGSKTQMVLFITLENFIYFNNKNLKKKWIINTNTVKNLDNKGKVIRIDLKFATKKKQNLVEELTIEDSVQRELIFKKLKEVMDIVAGDDIKF